MEKCIKSIHVKTYYPNLLISQKKYLDYYEKLAENNNSISFYFVKLCVQYAETIGQYIKELKYINCKTECEDFNNDLLNLYWMRFESFKRGLEKLLKLKDSFKHPLENYDIEDRIGILSYHKSLSAIEFMLEKVKNNKSDYDKVNNIIEKYKMTHDDNLLNEIKEIEIKYIIEGFENTSNDKRNNNFIIIIIIIILILFYCRLNK
jgi:hypothetical protein